MAINQKVIGVSTLIASILNLNAHRVQYDTFIRRKLVIDLSDNRASTVFTNE